MLLQPPFSTLHNYYIPGNIFKLYLYFKCENSLKLLAKHFLYLKSIERHLEYGISYSQMKYVIKKKLGHNDPNQIIL